MTPVNPLSWRMRVMLIVLLAGVVALSFVVLHGPTASGDVRVGPADCPGCAAIPRQLP
jgi:hypothetical protein